MSLLALKQSTLTANYKLILEPSDVVYTHAEVFSSRKSIPYRQITGIFRDAERCYIVWGGQVARFLHQPDNADYKTFIDELLRRIAATSGA